MPSFSSIFNRDLLADNMVVVAGDGLGAITASAQSQGVSYEDEDIAEAERYAFDYIENRLDAIAGKTPAGADVEDDVRNPWLDAGIDAATALAIAYFMRRTLRGREESEEEWGDVYYSGIAGAVVGRATMLAWDLLGKSFANGIIGFVSRFLPVSKTWLETTSKHPRDDHLAVVGETVPYDSLFSHGQFWSQESHNCKCGIDIRFGR